MNNSGKKQHWGKAVIAGGIAGAVEACVSYPTECVCRGGGCVRRRDSTFVRSPPAPPPARFVTTQLQLFEDKAKLGPIGAAKETIKKDGVGGLYRGLSSLLFFSVPKVATRFFAFETMRNQLKGPDGKMDAWSTLAAGLGAGAAEAIVAVTPMDTIKTRLIHDQLSNTPENRKYKGFAHGVSTIVKEQGLGGVYKGLTATIMRQGTNQAIRWLVFTRAKETMAGPGGDPSKLSVLHTIAASLMAGTASVYGNTPIDVVKTRMQGLSASKYKSTLDCAVQIAKTEGFSAFYKGATARLARVCLDVSLIMVLYEQINKALDKVWVTE